MPQEQTQPKTILRRLATVLLAGYLAAVVLFYFLAGEQLHLRESRGNIDILPAESGTVELTAGCVVEQRFSTKVQRLEQVSVQWGTYYRQNAGTVLVSCGTSPMSACSSPRPLTLPLSPTEALPP